MFLQHDCFCSFLADASIVWIYYDMPLLNPFLVALRFFAVLLPVTSHFSGEVVETLSKTPIDCLLVIKMKMIPFSISWFQSCTSAI